MWPLIEVAIEARTDADRAALEQALRNVTGGHADLSFAIDAESGQVLLGGNDETGLDTAIDSLRRSAAFDVGAPQVAYRETLGRKTDIDYTHKQQSGGTGQFARVKIGFEPGEPGSGFCFASTIIGDAVPSEYVPGVARGLAAAAECGLVAGFPLIDFKATLYDGSYHDVDSSVLAFEGAARGAFRELRRKGAPKLIEPIMRVEVHASDAHHRDVVGYLHACRGQVRSVELRDGARVVTAFVPLANMFGSAATLGGLSEGLVSFTMRYDHYAPVPQDNDDPDAFPPAAAMRA
jgi:elongation factor G